MNKLIIFSLSLFLTIHLTALSQTISINPVDAGPYGNGSSIAVSIKIDDTSGLLKADNTFRLFISDASGSFSTEKEIGTYPGFYTTFVNGIIPAGLPAGNYKVRIKSFAPAVVSQASNDIEVRAGAAVNADISTSTERTISSNPKTFGVCQPERSTNFTFTNNSTGGSNTSITFINELNRTDTYQSAFNTPAINFAAALTHYTITVRAELNGIIGTRSFFLINNVIKPGFNSPTNNTVCLPTKLQYDIETMSSNGIQNNFPGYTYRINWGDGKIEDFTPNQIYTNGNKVTHTYIGSSCGKQIKINDVTYYNVFGIIYQVNSPFCGLVSVPLSTQAKVITQPENKFGLPSAVCINTEITLTNTSIAGDNPSGNSPECTNNAIRYYWYVDGQAITPQGVPISYQPKITFTSPGTHTIRLESESNSYCEAVPIEKTTYVQQIPKPAFSLTETLACTGVIIKATDQSIIDPGTSAQNNYLWTVTGPAGVTYVNGTNNTSKNPEFRFASAGNYIVKLAINAPCGAQTAEQTVVINASPTITTTWAGNICGKGQVFTFNNTNANPVKTSFSGSTNTEIDTYTWSVSGGAYSFQNNTTTNSKEPSILFEDYGTYTISITHQNNCGTQTITKTIIFNESPTVNAGIDQTICPESTVTLNGSISGGDVTNYAWLGGNGTFSPSRNSLNAVYTPSSSEISAGSVQLKLSVNSSSPAPCNLVEDDVTITINPVNRITSSGTKNICTNTAVNYQPVALPGSTFTWTASASSNASGFSPSGTGEIKDVIINTDPTQEATITYIISPEKDGCPGENFTFTVIITATPAVNAVVDKTIICSGQEATISLTSNLPGMRYTWTSTASSGISGNTNQSSPVEITEIKGTFANIGNSTGSVTYTITPENITGCAGEPITVTINVSNSNGTTTFSPNKTTGCSPLAVTFNNSTSGSSNTYHWDFGDGQTLVTTDNNPVNHTYTSATSQTFTVKLITETDCGSFASEFVIRITPNTIQAELAVNGNEYEGCAPHTVRFFNNSKGALLYKYDFGDGTIIETNRSPETITHTFTKGGTYNVKFTASNGCSESNIIQTIRVYPQAITDFSADKTEGCTPLSIKFQNKSTGALSYLWDFDDGTVSTEENPVHIFSGNKPAYTITLITTSSFGCNDTLIMPDFIKVSTPPVVNFQVLPGEIIQYPNYRFTFKNTTSGDVTSYYWDFGDGTSSSSTNPEHSYADTGVYRVSLQAINSFACSQTLIKTVQITGTPGGLFIPNAFMPNSFTEELRTFKPKGSGIEKYRMRIFNKWGEMIWQTDKLSDKGIPLEGWDGTMHNVQAPQGIYFWEISAKFINGTEWAGMVYNGQEPKKVGTINLIR